VKRALVAPLASLFMPGMGQLINRQPVKGGLMVAAVSVLFIATLGLAFYKVSQAIVAVGDIPAHVDKWAALNVQLVAQGIVWLLIMLGLYVVVLIWAVADAFKTGRALDAAENKGEAS
jgi:hypothetical protein